MCPSLCPRPISSFFFSSFSVLAALSSGLPLLQMSAGTCPGTGCWEDGEWVLGSRGVPWTWRQAGEDTSRIPLTPAPQLPPLLSSGRSVCCHPTWGREAIMPRDRQTPLGAEGSGFGSGKWSRVLGPSWGSRSRSCLPLPPKLLSRFSIRQERLGAASCPQPSALLTGRPSRQPCPPPGPSDGSGLCLGQREANLGCYTSHTKTVLGPLALTGV